MGEWGINETITLAGVFLEHSNEQNAGLYCSNNTRSLWLSTEMAVRFVDGAFQGIVFMTAACSA